MVCLSVPASVIGLTGEFVLKVSMSSPFSSSQQPVVQFVKQGALNEEELAVFSAVLRTANLVTADKVAAAAAAQVGSRHVQGLLFVCKWDVPFTALCHNIKSPSSHAL